ncbi:MAG: methionine biosynthesis protein MetW [Victivallales bacterium]|nr:methionine biosynthesis protein MetW [Victivallales bacterium]
MSGVDENTDMPVANSATSMGRNDLAIIAELIPSGASVLDLGCGAGELLDLLRREKNVYACGVEVSQENLLECVRKGVPVIHADLNDGLGDFSEGSFDYVILSRVIQAVRRPDLLLSEMTKVGRRCVVSFLNIGYAPSRFQLTFRGRMPVTKALPYAWYDTPNIHLATIKDFRALCAEKGLRIIKELPFNPNFRILAYLLPNLMAPTCVFIIEGR